MFEIQNTGTAAAPVYASAPTTLVSFNGGNGMSPHGGLTADANGDLFGTTYESIVNGYGGGTVFEIQNTGTRATPAYANAPTTLAHYSIDHLNAGLTADANGDLFGTTVDGGAYDDGDVIEIPNIGTAAAPVYAGPTTLVSFNGSNGANPYAGVIVDANGNLFGTTEEGGASGDGTVFEILNAGTAAAPVYARTPTTLVSFSEFNGANPYAGSLIASTNGDLFGTTYIGGAYGYGTVFRSQNTGAGYDTLIAQGLR